ncbi:hypothetical protein GCM10027425_19910 [Alteromonas gracilis]
MTTTSTRSPLHTADSFGGQSGAGGSWGGPDGTPGGGAPAPTATPSLGDRLGKISSLAGVINTAIGMIPPDAIGKVIRELNKIGQYADEIINVINRTLDLIDWATFVLPDGFMDAVRAKVQKLYDEISRIWSAISKVLAWTGSPWDIATVSNTWLDAIARPADSAAGDLEGTPCASPAVWEGAAGDSYRAVIPGQTAAITAIVAPVVETAVQQLDTLSGAIVQFWVQLGIEVGILILELIIAAGETGTIVGIPLGLVTGIVAVGMFIIAVVGYVQSLQSTCTAIAAVFNGYSAEWPTVDGQDGPGGPGGPGGPCGPGGPGGPGGPEGPGGPGGPGGPEGPGGPSGPTGPSGGGGDTGGGGTGGGTGGGGTSGGGGGGGSHPGNVGGGGGGNPGGGSGGGGGGSHPGNVGGGGNGTDGNGGQGGNGGDGGDGGNGGQGGTGTGTGGGTQIDVHVEIGPDGTITVDVEVDLQPVPPTPLQPGQVPGGVQGVLCPGGVGLPDGQGGVSSVDVSVHITEMVRGDETTHVVNIPNVDLQMSPDGQSVVGGTQLAGLVNDAMNMSGVQPGDPVMLCGTGHGADAAVGLMNDPRFADSFNVQSAVVGGLSEGASAPAGVAMLDLDHQGVLSPGAHTPAEYADAARQLDAEPTTQAAEWRSHNGAFFQGEPDRAALSRFELMPAVGGRSSISGSGLNM